MAKPREIIRELRPHALWSWVEWMWRLVEATVISALIALWQSLHSRVDVALILIVFCGAVGVLVFGAIRKNAPLSALPEPSADLPETHREQQRTPNGLRRCASVLAGSLFSLLVEVGEKLEAPTLRTEDIFNAPPPPDPKIERLISDQSIDRQINDVFVYAEDLALLADMSAAVPRNVPEVRSKITDLQYLVGAIKH